MVGIEDEDVGVGAEHDRERTKERALLQVERLLRLGVRQPERLGHGVGRSREIDDPERHRHRLGNEL